MTCSWFFSIMPMSTSRSCRSFWVGRCGFGFDQCEFRGMRIMALDTSKFGLFALGFVPKTIGSSVGTRFPILISRSMAFGAQQDDVFFKDLRAVIVHKSISIFWMMTV